MPCLNEAGSLAGCIRQASEFLKRQGVVGEIIVADNGSTDDSVKVAESLGARVVRVQQRGYGSALAAGIAAAEGRFVVMGDSDGTYDFGGLMPFLQQLRSGAELVMGNRFAGGIAPGAMPWMHRYVGNPLLTLLGRVFFKSRCGDFYCGLRAFTKDAYQRMHLRSHGMEFALEMLVKATLLGMNVREVPTTLSPDLRERTPHLRRWRDGWRSLRLYLILSPKWLFFYPGLLLLAIGIVSSVALCFGPIQIAGRRLDYYALFLAATATILGIQATTLAVCAKFAAIRAELHPGNPRFERLLRRFHLEHGILAGTILGLIGLAGVMFGVYYRSLYSIQELSPGNMLRIFIPSATLMISGAQIWLVSFFLSTIRMYDDWRPKSEP
jgi:glycosyltransferase involved in cell wall biosynthesis